MIGGVDGYKWNITDSYDNNLNQRNNVKNKEELGPVSYTRLTLPTTPGV